MSSTFRNIVAGFSFFAALAGSNAQAQETRVTPQARSIATILDRMNVETKWPAGTHVDWRTGVPDGMPERSAGRHTHCSAFVASAAQTLGVYILRPPEHGQVLLANAQNEWLSEEGRAAGWKPLNGPVEAQDAANRGLLVVASYHNHNDDKPGHIAIVRPGSKSAAELTATGPDVIQAATVNSSSISVKAGFAGHIYAWNNNEIDYYAHSVKIPGSSSND